MSAVRRPSILVIAALLGAGCAGASPSTPAAAPTTGTVSTVSEERPTVTVHRSPTCACCGEYEDHLEEHGFEVVIEEHDDVTGFKDAAGIPPDLRSCHTNEVEGYLVEGHVPVEAIEDLLEQRPDAVGVALPGMPAGSPGMPGEQEEPFVVEAFAEGEAAGEFGRY
jgi:hypothetical protein